MVEKKVKKETKKKVEEKEKLVVNFNSLLEENKETIQLEVTINKPLQLLLRKVAVSGEREFQYLLGKDEEGRDKIGKFTRTKVKTAIWNGFNGEGRDLLFIKDLILNGKFKFDFYDVSLLERTMSIITANMNRAIELISECSNIKQKISFVVE